ncbi:unnamed protein product [Cylindrotheca closterium]|uniref:Transmembrane protein 231 n=1 Tax=Cylindrotheca closterium TaxID=2856 RepID=A0AAD2JP53_9STRA|nr:unnamed protein product [Cylindrotheca closterium]
MRLIPHFLASFLVFYTTCNSTSGSDEVLSVVTSSDFQMELSPTVEKLDATAASKVELAIKSAILLAASETETFQFAFDVDIVLQKIEWLERTNESVITSSSLLQFEVHMAFFKGDADLPSAFALDNLISRTFSQPSSRATFLGTLELSQEPVLSSIKTVQIGVLEDTSSEDVTTAQPKLLSSLDIVLITASVIMFLGVVYVIYQYHKDKTRLEEQQNRTFQQWNQRTRKDRNHHPKVNYAAELNQTGFTSVQSDTESTPGSESRDETTTRHPDSNIRMFPSPPISPNVADPILPDELHSSEKKKPPTLAPPAATRSNRLGFRLSSLPSMNPSGRRKGISQSSLSAQENYMRSVSDISASKGSSVGDMSSVFKMSAMSAASSNGDVSSIFKTSARRGSYQQSQGSVASKSNASSEKTRRITNRCFNNNWSEHKRKPLEDVDDQIMANVFHVGTTESQDTDEDEDDRSRMSGSGLSTISEWMKSIRVVSSRSERRRSSVRQYRLGARSVDVLPDHASVLSSNDSSSAASAPI